MSYLDSLEGSTVKAAFRTIGVTGTPGDPYMLAITGVTNVTLTSTDLVSAMAEAEIYLTTSDYLQVTYWSVWNPTDEARSLWVHA